MFNPLRKAKNGVVNFYTKRSTLAFFSTLVVLFALIALAHYLRTPEPEVVKPERVAKKTALYSAESPLYLQATSEVKKEGVTTIVALTSGIVSTIIAKPGMEVGVGNTLLILTNDYNSGSAELEKAIAENDLILTEKITDLDQDVEQTEKEIVRNNDELTRRQEEVALQTLKVERETRKIELVNARLNYRLALVDDAVLKPKSLNNGSVQSVAVKKGDYVSPGTTLATISNSSGNTVVEAFVVSEIAPFIDITKAAKITLNDGSIVSVVPNYFSASEDQDGMFMIQFILSDEVASKISVSQNPKVELPIRFTHEATILVPLDTVYKNSDSSVVLINKDGVAEARTITLGRVRGNYIEVMSGLEKSDQIILNRFVLAGDRIEVGE